MQKLFFIAIAVLITFSVALSQTWNSTLTLNTSSLNYSSSDMIDTYTNSDGIHIIVHQSSKIHHYLYDNAGLHIRHSERASFTESPRRSRITGYDDKLYIVYKRGDYIYTQKSTNGGSSWSTSIDEIELDYSTVNGMEVVADENGVHIVWAEEQSTDHFETYYRKLTHTATSWGDFKNVTDYSGHEGGAPSITTAPDINKIYVTYSDRDEDNPHGVYPPHIKFRIKSNTTWLTPETISGTWCWTACIITDNDDFNVFTYTATDNTGGFIHYALQFQNRDRDYTSGSWTVVDYGLSGFHNAYVDEKYRIDIAKTQNGLTHMVYQFGKYRDWDGSDLSDEYSLNSLSPHQISVSGDDVYCAWMYDDSGDLKFKLKQRDYDPPTVTISSSVVSGHPKISWSAPAGVADIDEYEVWRYRTVSGGGYTLCATVTGTTYTDNSITVIKIPPYNRA